MAVLRLIGAVHAIAIDHAGPRAGQIAVPHLVGAFRQGEPSHLAPAGGVEQAEVEAIGVRRKYREVDAEAVPGRPEQ
jgi:hypothetical protein